MTFAAVIVLHESRAELNALLESLTEPEPRLIVVDTGRDDGGAALARAHGAEVLERRDNPGFGAASNAGLQRVTEDVTILLNPDIVVHDQALAELARRAGNHPRALHAPGLLNLDGSVQRSAHPLPGTLGAFLPALVHPPALPRAIRERVEPYRARSPRTVGWAIAACLAGATPTLRQLGPFDPNIHSSPRTWICACAHETPASRRSCTRISRSRTPAATAFCARASRSNSSPVNEQP